MLDQNIAVRIFNDVLIFVFSSCGFVDVLVIEALMFCVSRQSVLIHNSTVFYHLNSLKLMLS